MIRNQIAYLFEKNKPLFKQHIDFLQEWEVMDNSLRRTISEVESLAMSMRMTSLRSPFSRMKKVVREYLRSANKKVKFITEGEEVELDKKVIDALSEPLVHLVRNALDHGIESSEERKAQGKDPCGTIKLSASVANDKVVIKISDDGKGIDLEKLRSKAVKQGLQIEHFENEQDLLELIFQPGLSTAEKVSDISGRGVGMDAVRQSVRRLGGDVRVETESGKGTSFSIELPLSMSLISAVIFEINGRQYAAAISDILEICRVSHEDIVENNGEKFFLFRDRYIPTLDLRQIVHCKDFNDRGSEPFVSLCVVDVGEELVAYRVSRVIQHTELVVKELKGCFPKSNIITGVSILPTGKPIFVLGLDRLYSHSKGRFIGEVSHVRA